MKIPPIEKIPEAYSALVDERVNMKENEAEVDSSDYSKKYIVKWEENIYSSSDNASFWQGYPGYPIIAVLMIQKKLSYNIEIANYFKGINWKSLNKKYKNNYSKALNEIMENLKEKDIDVDKINSEIKKVYEEIKNLDIIVKRKI